MFPAQKALTFKEALGFYFSFMFSITSGDFSESHFSYSGRTFLLSRVLFGIGGLLNFPSLVHN